MSGKLTLVTVLIVFTFSDLHAQSAKSWIKIKIRRYTEFFQDYKNQGKINAEEENAFLIEKKNLNDLFKYYLEDNRISGIEKYHFYQVYNQAWSNLGMYKLEDITKPRDIKDRLSYIKNIKFNKKKRGN